MAQRKFRMSRSIIYGYFPPGVKWLLIVNCLIFVIEILAGPALQTKVTFWFALIPGAIVYFLHVWQLFTYMFLHGGFGHLIGNMLTLWMFGMTLEQTWGTRRFLKYYFTCGVGAGVCVLLVNMAVGNWTQPTIGASGAIFGVLLAFGVLFPDTKVLMDFLFPIKAKYLVMIYGAVAFLSALGSGNSGVSNVAHLGGLLVGWIYLRAPLPRFRFLQLPDAGGWYRQWRMQRAKKKFQVYMRKQGGRGPWVN